MCFLIKVKFKDNYLKFAKIVKLVKFVKFEKIETYHVTIERSVVKEKKANSASGAQRFKVAMK